ncbi:cytochrome P450 [Guyanagaster necrorhizus]|uniref:Cytochrome P450 n=1 Tax=Guyanagaster necrorhizus TaxID=856835 RepID=A0A9P7W229_9AGAR|nr:cytochrome P450 [Guyanagaster necrorhizus MCA 3950]KAG7451288.1 cytochrome P450 [Guyanagaster necrorhizus MCA 3950]
MNSSLLLASGVLLLYCLFYLSRKRRCVPLPPGPKGLPLIGNLWNISTEYPWITYARWATIYGDVLYLDTPGNPTVVLNSAQAAADLFERRSRNYSDRPELDTSADVSPIFSTPCSSGLLFRGNESNICLQQLHKSPDALVRHVRHHSGSIIMKTVYGYVGNPNGNRFVELVDRSLESIRIIGNVGSFLVDYIPDFPPYEGWILGAKFVSLADVWRKDVEDMKEGPFKYALESLVNGLAPSSFVSVNLKKMKETGTSENVTQLEIIRNTAGVAFAGVDTACFHLCASFTEVSLIAEKTVSVVLSAILAFVLYPELPDVDAILLEALRWNPVLPRGIAHRSIKGDVYRGHYILAGATVIGNVWTIPHDERDYPNPLVFNPDRFMSEDWKEPQPEPIAAFGFGRRCV